jgi:rsbT antagonist protein RsbS
VARAPVIRIDQILVATVQEDLFDRDALQLQEDLAAGLETSNAQGVLIDLSSVKTVDSFLGRLLNDVATSARLLGAETVVVGVQPAVAITLVELGLELRGVMTALNADKGLALLRSRINHPRQGGR